MVYFQNNECEMLVKTPSSNNNGSAKHMTYFANWKVVLGKVQVLVIKGLDY